MTVVSVQGLAKTYGGWFGRGVEALKGVTLDVREGEVFGLLGQNGAGKTTLVKCLLSLCRPTRGRAHLFGEPASRTRLRRDVGYLPEDHRFPDYHTGRSALRFYAHMGGMRGADLARRIDEVLAVAGIAEWADARVRKYSKGMKQRLGFANAILHRPRLLFLDEPTDGVDPVGRKHFRDVLLDLKRQGTTIFLNSHLLSEVEMVCDRVMILRQGEAVKEGSLDALTREERQFELQVAGDPDRAMETLKGKFAALIRAERSILLRVERDEDLDRAVDLLRAAGIGLRALVPGRRTLEDVFIEAVGADGKGGGA